MLLSRDIVDENAALDLTYVNQLTESRSIDLISSL